MNQAHADRLMKLICEACDDKIVMKNPNMELFKTGLIDSMGFIMLLIEIENEFGFEIEPVEINKESFNTPNRIMEYVESRLQGKG